MFAIVLAIHVDSKRLLNRDYEYSAFIVNLSYIC